ncbi:MAG: bifunctional phosphoribosylaminoimidazolecarboxamide formyltransferase/IMP cyclohydrolase [Candidatus Symbiobacter sp.]|nr:bifunctional phosphoribosylaminoimidazolecarboxamide formyltransferase/IMP cyclohydrolase [Candidatus Symbiobacter sp.]
MTLFPAFPADPDARLMPRRALISLSDKTGLDQLAASLKQHQIDVISTGGTAAALRGFGLAVRDVAEVTGFPECLDGRVKTLHPKIHGGILARRDNREHLETSEKLGLEPIDLLIVSLYPFAQKSAEYDKIVAEHGENSPAANSPTVQAALAEVIEAIDIGGPSLIRGAAKNHPFVAVITAPSQYPALIAALDQGGTNLAERQGYAAAAFAHTAAYDARIAAFCHQVWGGSSVGGQDGLPAHLTLVGELVEKLAYGENPHQPAGLYRCGSHGHNLVTATQVLGKKLSYNNLNDGDLAWAAAVDLHQEFGKDAAWNQAVVIVKHATPCGAAIAADGATAFARAYDSDPVSAYGGVVAANCAIDAAMAALIAPHFFEVIIAPGISEEALALLKRREAMRILLTGGITAPPPSPANPQNWQIRTIEGGFLRQSPDHGRVQLDECQLVTARGPSPQEKIDLCLAWRVVKYARSNAIVLAKQGQIIGVGSGQTSRVDAAKQAVAAAGERAAGSVVASDAFFPFKDGLAQCLTAGVTAVIQPGGSKRDDEVVACANHHHAAMLFTHMRHFRH